MELRDWTYEEYPEFTDLPEGAVNLPTTGDEMGCYYAHDVEYAVVDGIRLCLQILQPVTRNSPEKKYPCIVFVQGSGWEEQEMYHLLPKLTHLAEQGYVIAAVQYRHSRQATFPAQVIDMHNAIRFMKKHADEYCVIPDQIFASGSSSGGHTAVFSVLMNDDEEETNLFPGISADVLGVLDLYGCVTLDMPDGFPVQLNSGEPDSIEGLLLGGVALKDHPDLVEQASAVSHIREDVDIPPVLIIHGSKDRQVNPRQSAELYQKLKDCGKDVQFYVVKGGDHGGSEFWSEEVVTIENDFLQRCIRERKW